MTDNQPTQDADAGSLPPAPAKLASEFVAPEQFFVQEVAAKVYRDKLRRLRAGRPSGISRLFGSAIDLFCGPLDETVVRQLDLTNLEPIDALDSEVRMQNLVNEVESSCRKFADDHLSAWRAGTYDCGTSVTARHAISDEVKAVICKTSAITLLVMITVDQQEQDPPEWFKALMWRSLEKTNDISRMPEVAQLLDVLWEGGSISTANMCKNVTRSICDQLGFGGIGEPAWNAVYDFFSKTRRTNFVERALSDDVS